ncbi:MULTISPECIES: hypothetical protein [Photorhabdus]
MMPPSHKQQDPQIQKAFLNTLAETVNPKAKVILVTNSGFQSA